jgi:hypothetical protein
MTQEAMSNPETHCKVRHLEISLNSTVPGERRAARGYPKVNIPNPENNRSKI